MPPWAQYLTATALTGVGVGFAVAARRLQRPQFPPTSTHPAPLPPPPGGSGPGGIQGTTSGSGTSPIPTVKVGQILLESGEGSMRTEKPWPEPFVISSPVEADVGPAPGPGQEKKYEVSVYASNEQVGWEGHASVEATFKHTGVVAQQTSGPEDSGDGMGMKRVNTDAGPWLALGFKRVGDRIKLVARGMAVPVTSGGYPASNYQFAAGPPPHDFRSMPGNEPITGWASSQWDVAYAWRAT